MTDDKSQPGTDHSENEGESSDEPKKPSKWAHHKPHARDSDTGLAVRKNGEYIAASTDGSGAGIRKIKIIPPADMAELAKNGIAPYEIPNWDKDDPESNWYLQYRKFTPERRAVFLAKLEQHGRIGLAARWAGVVTDTVNRHRKEDPEFDHACNESLSYYHEMCVAGITHQARVGMIDEKYDKEGKLISRRVSYEQQLRMMMVKRADPSYNDIQKQEVSVVGGAVVVPAPIDSVESWEDVVRRHTGGGNAAAVGNSPLSAVNGAQRTLIAGERSEPSAVGQGPEPGVSESSAVAEGRVVKRTILEAEGSEIKENEHKEE